MGNKALKIFYAVFMALMLVALTVFMVIHIRAGLDGNNAKILLAGYVLLIIWAAGRLFTLIRNLRIKESDTCIYSITRFGWSG